MANALAVFIVLVNELPKFVLPLDGEFAMPPYATTLIYIVFWSATTNCAHYCLYAYISRPRFTAAH
jgi:hypothetical protein